MIIFVISECILEEYIQCYKCIFYSSTPHIFRSQPCIIGFLGTNFWYFHDFNILGVEPGTQKIKNINTKKFHMIPYGSLDNIEESII